MNSFYYTIYHFLQSIIGKCYSQKIICPATWIIIGICQKEIRLRESDSARKSIFLKKKLINRKSKEINDHKRLSVTWGSSPSFAFSDLINFYSPWNHQKPMRLVIHNLFLLDSGPWQVPLLVWNCKGNWDDLEPQNLVT